MNVNGNDDSQIKDGKANSQPNCLIIPSFDDFDIANYRHSLGMSQSEFAKAHEISLGTLKKWERKSSEPVFGGGFKKILQKWMNENAEVQYL